MTQVRFALMLVMVIFSSASMGAAEQNLPHFDHVVVAVLENHAFDQIVDRDRAPYIFSLAEGGALFVSSYAITHPSQPNYFALFSGSTQGVRDNDNHTLTAPNLADALQKIQKSFIGYIEPDSPRKHNPWESFTNASSVERNISQFPSDFAQLPTVSFVIPNEGHDMHSGSVQEGDNWLKAHLSEYAEWAKTHDSLLIVTFDEDDSTSENRILTIFYGAHVRPGQYAERITHYSVLSTLLAMYGAEPFGEARMTPAIRTIWHE